jgi:hypothetical protein
MHLVLGGTLDMKIGGRGTSSSLSMTRSRVARRAGARVGLAERAGLAELLAKYVRPDGGCGVNAPLKVGCRVAGIAAGADSDNDMGLLRHGAMDGCSAGPRPSSLGSHLR